MQRVIELLNLDSPGGQVIGIHGLPGVGKTTIAKVVYNVVSSRFDKYCFLEKVSSTLSKDDGVIILQNKILSSIFGEFIPIKSASEGVNTMRDRVCLHKILIVLDDVGDKSSFDRVFGKLGNFSILESRFIITTKNTEVLEFSRGYKSHEVKEMSTRDSLQLFCKHAYHPNDLPNADLALAREFVELAGRLPLALEVIGSLLLNRDIEFWEEKLIELGKVPCTNDKVRDTLMISYKELSPTQKQIFLDISCIFVGEDKEFPFHMWTDSEFYPVGGITTLMSRSLVKVNEKNQFRMHDLLRDLGRYIVEEEDVDHPWNRSRIWKKGVVVDMLKNNKGTDRVKIMRVVMEKGYKLTSEAFKKLSGLRYLDVECGSLTGDFSQILPNLIWFRLSYYGRIPANLSMKKCAILELTSCHVTDDWSGWKEIKKEGKLKVLNMRGCTGMEKSPNLSSCRDMEVLRFQNCSMEGHLDIGNLKKLKRLIVHHCHSIKEIRGDIGLLRNLKQFVLDDVSIRKPPSGIGKLSSLEILRLDVKVDVIEDVPTSLKQLSISCSTVPNLLELKNLEKLSFRLEKPDIPNDLRQLSMLKTLDVSCCSSQDFTTLHQVDLPHSLNRIEFSSCSYLERLPNLANLGNNLTQLYLSSVDIREISDLGKLRMLAKLDLWNLEKLERLDGLENLVMLKEATLVDCGTVERITNLSNLTRLHTLVISLCWYLTEIQLLQMVSLTTLKINDCICLSTVEGLESLESLQVLSTYSCLYAEWLPKSLTQLRKLEEFRYVEKSKFVPQGMSLKECPQLPVNLKRLTLKCEHLETITGLGELESLEELVMSGCSSIKEVNLSSVTNLTILKAVGCKQLTNIIGLEELVLLEVIEIDTWLKWKLLLKLSATQYMKQFARLLGF